MWSLIFCRGRTVRKSPSFGRGQAFSVSGEGGAPRAVSYPGGGVGRVASFWGGREPCGVEGESYCSSRRH